MPSMNTTPSSAIGKSKSRIDALLPVGEDSGSFLLYLTLFIRLAGRMPTGENQGFGQYSESQ